MARWVKSYNQMRIYKQTATPTSASDGLKVGDLWIDTNSGAILKICTAIGGDTFDTIADLVSPSFTTPVLGAASATSLDFTDTAGLIGTTTNDNADTGSVGEIVSSNVAFSARSNIATATDSNVTSISLTAGDWDVSGIVGFFGTGTTSVTMVSGWISSTSATAPDVSLRTAEAYDAAARILYASGTMGTNLCIRPTRMSLSGTTTIYLSARSVFSASTLACYGIINARRIR